MVQMLGWFSAEAARFPAKSLQGLRVSRQSLRQKFQRHESPEFGVLCFVDDTHPSGAQCFQNSVMRDCFSAKRPQVGHCVPMLVAQKS